MSCRGPNPGGNLCRFLTKDRLLLINAQKPRRTGTEHFAERDDLKVVDAAQAAFDLAERRGGEFQASLLFEQGAELLQRPGGRLCQADSPEARSDDVQTLALSAQGLGFSSRVDPVGFLRASGHLPTLGDRL